jgi:hypothetical protein
MCELATKVKAMLLSGAESNQGVGAEELTTPPDMVETSKVIHVSYQRIFYDWALADGGYTPEQLRKAKMVVKPWGPVQSYTITGRGAV